MVRVSELPDDLVGLMRHYSIDPGFAHMHDTGEMPVYDRLIRDPDPDVCFVGEAPGRTEQRTGEPFVGQSGRVLRELLASIELSRDDIYITNVVKYRPVDEAGKNRPPSPAEVQASLPFLRRELNIINPKVLCPLGAFALRAVLPDAPPVSVAHGCRYTSRRGRTVVALYHPAVALYQPKAMSMLLNDFLAVRDALKDGFE